MKDNIYYIHIKYMFVTSFVALFLGLLLGYGIAKLQYNRAIARAVDAQVIAQKSMILTKQCVKTIEAYVGQALVARASPSIDCDDMPEVY